MIPESLYPFDAGPGREPLVIVANAEAPVPRRSPTGIYDRDLVCRQCEERFTRWDDYAHRFFSPELPRECAIRHENEVLAYRIPVDYALLKLFFVSLLWRSHATAQPIFSGVEVGPFAPQLREMVLNADPGGTNDFPVFLAKFDDPLGTALLNPHRERWFGVNYYRFYLRGYIAHIKVDRRLAPAEFRAFQLSPDAPLTVLQRDFRGSPEHNLMLRLIAEQA
jgi:hypothetical protein